MDYIYLITVIEKLGPKDVDTGYMDTGYTRSVGWYSSLKEARRCVEHNIMDIHEELYNYAIIEKVIYGLYPDIDAKTERWIYKYNIDKNKYEIMEGIPKSYLNYYNILGDIG